MENIEAVHELYLLKMLILQKRPYHVVPEGQADNWLILYPFWFFFFFSFASS